MVAVQLNGIPISIHAPREGSDTVDADGKPTAWISIHAPREGSDFDKIVKFISRDNFNPRSPRGERLTATCAHGTPRPFQSTLPARGATVSCSHEFNCFTRFQSTLPARGATIHKRIHFLLPPISIHAPREGSDALVDMQDEVKKLFQSTLPARGATYTQRGDDHGRYLFQSTLPARGATTDWQYGLTRDGFQSTLPARGATSHDATTVHAAKISIHAPREGSDGSVNGAVVGRHHFNPRSPRGERPAIAGAGSAAAEFQSTLPARGATRLPKPRSF